MHLWSKLSAAKWIDAWEERFQGNPNLVIEYLKSGKSIRVSIAMAEPVDASDPADLPPGTLDEDLHVICGQNALKITKIKPAGSPLMDFKAFTNGRQTKPGDLLVRIGK